MLHVVLYQPEIPPNTGNIIRLCANTGYVLHLVGPLGFELDEPRLRRAGLDYREWTSICEHASLDAFEAAHSPRRTFAFSTRGGRLHCDVSYREGDALLFGPETSGLPDAVLARYPRNHRLRIPMRPLSRSLNLSNAVAVACYEAWRQLSFRGQHLPGA
ncbi:MAG: tRNA (cytidine(34)-2'-O)-methyltransferase [Gammaproteobacteria bacterium]|nr:tRNA (cytidine(34)-2'-O)-methyltransferase [Gammaproteobacteria bacterium]